MSILSSQLLALGAALLPGGEPEDPPAFAKPVRIRAGEAFAGAKRLYPSPVLHDVDGDDLPDIVIGDLMGRVTFAPRLPTEGPAQYDIEQPLKDRRGERLKFSNW